MDWWEPLEFDGAFTTFYEACDSELQEAIDERFDYVCQHGNSAGLPYTRHLKGGLFEIRARAGTRQARFISFFLPGKRFVVAVAFRSGPKNNSGPLPMI